MITIEKTVEQLLPGDVITGVKNHPYDNYDKLESNLIIKSIKKDRGDYRLTFSNIDGEKTLYSFIYYSFEVI